ncbi:MAG: hypothetical protein KF799_08880 [Bdellovibrionales bacterium]|nr:hypothetical protein [Bdellovibrionales bacterium]
MERELKRFVRQIRPGLIGATSNPNVNLALLIEEIKASPALREQLIAALQNFLVTRDFTTALTETGLTLEAGMFSEIYKRLEYKLLPKPVESLDILSFLRRVFDAQSDASWLESIDREQFGEFLTLILPDHEKIVEQISPQLFMSLEILSLRLAGLGYEPVVTHRLKARREYQHAFMDVVRHVHTMLEKGEEAVPALRDSLDRCSQAVRWVRSRRSVEGVSLALTYRLIKIQQVVERMQQLLDLLESILGRWDAKPAQNLFFEIMLSELRRFELRRFLGDNLELLAFQITEHTGKTGEHYITRTRSEWAWMFRSAAVGGAVVAVLAVLKFLAAMLHLPTGPEALLFGTIYAVGFLVIHTLGGTLATKQPAMTASTLAASLDEATASHSAMEGLAEVIVRTIRSQLIAMFGNVFAAIPVAILLCAPLVYLNHPLLSQEKALSTLASFHPFKSLSFLYAAQAGVLLFVSGLLAGFADNWFVFNHVGSRLRQSELLKKMVGAPNLDRAIQVIDHNLGAWVGNATLGYFLAFLPALGILFGLPLDVRHVTFSSGQFGAALMSLKFDVSLLTAVTIMLTILGIGLLNLAVSFSLTLFVVVKSRKIRFSQTPLLLRMLSRRLRRQPLELLFPLRDPP